MKSFCISLLAGFAMVLYAQAEIYETQVEQSSGEDGACAQFKLWIPRGSHPGHLIALTWGGNQCSLDTVNDPSWQALAQQTGSGLLTCFFVPQTSQNPWDHATEGSGQALLDALSVLAQMSDQPQLADARLYLVGDSQGGQFSFSFAGWKPDRVLGFVSIKGGRHEASAVETAARVPGLFFIGGLDLPFRIQNIEQTFARGRAQGATWCLANDRLGKHSPDSCAPLLRIFLQELASLQDRPAPPSASSPKILGSDSADSWFPTRRFREEYAVFESGKLALSTPELTFASKMPELIATGLPDSCEAGTIYAGDKSPMITIKAISNVPLKLDAVKVLNRLYLEKIKTASIAPDTISVSFKLNTVGLPLGRFSGMIPIRFFRQGKPVLGALNVPLTATILGDVEAKPSFIYLQLPTSTFPVPVNVDVHSKSTSAIKLLSCETPAGVSLTSAAATGGFLALKFSFAPESENSANEQTGNILLHLQTNKNWDLRIPYWETSELQLR